MWWLPTATEQMNQQIDGQGGLGASAGPASGRSVGMMKGDGAMGGDQETRDLLRLAAEQRMNTDLRR